ncbi:MAG: aspartate/glutamate racemase family protein [Gammaproteobacteria bacterium]
MLQDNPRIVLIHATPLSIAPIADAFAAAWPEPELVNLLDDALSRDRARDGVLTEAMCLRFERLGDYATEIRAQAILFTCSAFGPAIERVQQRLPIPVLKPNEAMLAAALQHGGRIGLVATFAATIDSMGEEIRALARSRGVELELHTRLASGAMAALAGGAAAEHDRLIAAAAATLPAVDALILAQFSMARAQAALRPQTPCPVLTAPDSAVARLRELMRFAPENAKGG